MNSGAGLGAEVGARLLVLGDYWHPDRDERTEIGLLIHRAKDLAEEVAAQELAKRFASLASHLAETAERPGRLVVPVPSKPVLAREGDRPHLATYLAASLAAAGAGEYRPSLAAKTNDTPRLRHTDPQWRADVAVSAGYRASESTAGRHIVVVDDRDPDRLDGESGGGLPARRGSGFGDSSRGRPHQTPLTARLRRRPRAPRTGGVDGRRASRTGSRPEACRRYAAVPCAGARADQGNGLQSRIAAGSNPARRSRFASVFWGCYVRFLAGTRRLGALGAVARRVLSRLDGSARLIRDAALV